MSNNDIAVKVENISKCYRIGLKENMHDTVGKSVFNFMKTPYKNFCKYRSLYKFKNIENEQVDPDIIWVLKNISFQVKVGEVVGIVGLNGAGKSTLLKILSRITVPTGGRALIRGRISSLLEVGTGFHPELTGRENIYLNGTILGMRKKEIDKKLDAIIDFSGIEKFIETPVKRYSSGMRVRLAFAVAAHLEPEILLIDEVLAVGDVRFQQKCLKKMEEVGQHGRTVFFVSHNMPSVTRLCSRTILLENGRIIADGNSHDVVSNYLVSQRSSGCERKWEDLAKAPGDSVVRLCAVRARTEEGHVSETMNVQKPIGIEIEYEVLKPGYVFIPYFHVLNDEGIEIFTPYDNDKTWMNKSRPIGRYIGVAWIPGNLLSEGMLYIGVGIRTIHPMVRRVREGEVIAFNVVDSLKSDKMDEYDGKFRAGVVRPSFKWDTKYIPSERNA